MSGKIFLASVITSILILAPVTYFVLPVLYPSMKQDPGDQGILLQSKFVTFNTPAYIFDDETAGYILMPDTQTTITTEGNSSLVVLFTAVALVALSPTFTTRSSYNISLVIEGIGNVTTMVIYFDGSPATGTFRELSLDLTINLATGELPASTYNVSLQWFSTFDATGTNSLSVNHDPTFDYERTLWIQEISTG